jgi:hypothetical protein
MNFFTVCSIVIPISANQETPKYPNNQNYNANNSIFNSGTYMLGSVLFHLFSKSWDQEDSDDESQVDKSKLIPISELVPNDIKFDKDDYKFLKLDCNAEFLKFKEFAKQVVSSSNATEQNALSLGDVSSKIQPNLPINDQKDENIDIVDVQQIEIDAIKEPITDQFSDNLESSELKIDSQNDSKEEILRVQNEEDVENNQHLEQENNQHLEQELNACGKNTGKLQNQSKFFTLKKIIIFSIFTVGAASVSVLAIYYNYYS